MKYLAAAAFVLALGMGAAYAEELQPERSAANNSEHATAGSGGAKVVDEGAKVTIAFTIFVPESNEVIPNNVGEFAPGEHQLIPALEDALMGLQPGDRKRVDLQPEQAFGSYDEQKMMRVTRDMLPPTAQAGRVYQTAHGQPFTIVALRDQTAVIDFNHPLAGKHLVFDVHVVRVEPRS
jgi:FKBP-type peptidyl-prolyl cis-trans isomerase 2